MAAWGLPAVHLSWVLCLALGATSLTLRDLVGGLLAGAREELVGISVLSLPHLACLSKSVCTPCALSWLRPSHPLGSPWPWSPGSLAFGPSWVAGRCKLCTSLSFVFMGFPCLQVKAGPAHAGAWQAQSSNLPALICILDRTGSSWLLLAPPGSSWLPLVPPGSSWLLLAPPGSPWLPLAPQKLKKLYVYSFFSWLLLAPPKRQDPQIRGSLRFLGGGNPAS